MAKANKSAVQSAPAASAAGAPPAPARGSSSPEAVKVEQEARDGLLSMAEVLAGVGGAEEPDAESAAMQDESAEIPAKAKAKADKTAEPDDDASVVADDLEDDGPVLSDDEPDDDDEDAEADGAAEDDNDETDEASPEDIAKALEKKTFKLREQRRELRAQLEAAQKEAEELRGKVSKLESLPTGAAETGPFANAKSEADIKMEETRLTQFVDWMDDLLDDRQEIYVLQDAQGQEVEHDRATLRAWKKQAQGQLAQANDARAALQRAADSDATAREALPLRLQFRQPAQCAGAGSRQRDSCSQQAAQQGRPARTAGCGQAGGEWGLHAREEGAKPTAKSGRAPVKATSPATPPARRSPAPTQRRPELMQRLSSGDQAAQLEAAMDLIPD
jgi:hypothetical protein